MRLPTRPAARAPRLSFSLRLFGALLVTVAVIGAGQYLLAARQITHRMVEQAEDAYVSDTRVMEAIYGSEAGDPMAPVTALVGHISMRMGVQSAVVVDGSGRIVARGMDHPAGMSMNDAHATTAAPPAAGPAQPMAMPGPPPARTLALQERRVADAALAGGRPARGDGAGGATTYAIPFTLGGRPHVLAVVKRDATLAAQLSDMRWILLVTLLGGLLVAVPVFYVAGGRALSTRYRAERYRSSRDALTDLGNHRSFHEDLRRKVEIAQRRDGTVSLALVDVDAFKGVNDGHGHAHGDAVLRHVARLLSAGRAEDGAYRVGGDEFALLLPGTSAEDAEVVAERIRARVAEELEAATVSIGIAELGRPAGDAGALLATADMALYAAKDAGRNRVRVAGEPISA